MATFVLIPGADGRAWYWHRLVPELNRRGHEAIAVELPPDGSNGLSEYADAVVHAAGSRSDLVLVAQSLGAFTAPLVCDRLPVQLLVLLNPMVPAPGETGDAWWGNTGQDEARVAAAEAGGWPAEFELHTGFFHDVPERVTAEAFEAGGGADLTTVFTQPWPLEAWPAVPTRLLQGSDDRFFPPEFQGRIARERLGIDSIDLTPGGHLLALSRPEELAARLSSYVRR